MAGVRNQSIAKSTVGPLPQPTTSPEPHVWLHDCRGGEQPSHPRRRRPSKKERLRRGRDRDKARLAALRERLSSSDDSERSTSLAAVQLVSQTVAAEAAAAAGALGCLRHNASDEQAASIAASVHASVMALASVDHSGSDRSSDEDFARSEHPGAEAGASAAAGLGNAVMPPYPGSEAVASEANGAGNDVCGNAEAFDIFDAADTVWQEAACYHRVVVDVNAGTALPASDGAVFAAGAHHSECAHPEPLTATVVATGGGSPGTTPKEPSTSSTTSSLTFHGAATQSGFTRGACGYAQCGHLPAGVIDVPAIASPRAIDANSVGILSDFNSQNLAKTVVPSHSGAYDGRFSSTSPPGSSNPGDQSGAVDFFIYSGKSEKSSGSDAGSELPTAETAPVVDGGGIYSSQDLANTVYEPLSTGMQSCATPGAEAVASAADDCGPLPLQTTDALEHVEHTKDFNSHKLATSTDTSLPGDYEQCLHYLLKLEKVHELLQAQASESSVAEESLANIIASTARRLEDTRMHLQSLRAASVSVS